MRAKLEQWYKQGLWTRDMLRDAVQKKIITEFQYAEITGEEF